MAAAPGSKPSNLIHVESEPGFAAAMDQAGPKLVVVDFFAEWCGPCKMIAPIFAGFARKYPDVLFVKVDSDKCNALSSRYAVRALPTFVFIIRGSKVATLTGADPQKLEGAIVEHKPIAGTTLSWGGPDDHATAVGADGVGAGSLKRYEALSAADQGKVDSIITVTACSRTVAAAALQKHGMDTDAATMAVLTNLAALEAFAAAEMPAAPTAAVALAAAISALGTAAGVAGAGAAAPAKSGGAALQFRMAAKASVKMKETFDKSATIASVAAWLKSKLPEGATFTLRTRNGAAESALDSSATLEAAGLAPRGLIIVADCAAVAFL